MFERRKIIRACRDREISVVDPHDFETAPADPISEVELAERPELTLYCFDFERDCAIFVESSNQESVDRSPFYYQGQAQFATHTVTVPIADFHRLARAIPVSQSNMVFVHSVGRCGSTLVSKVLQASDSVHSLSEPDDLTQLVPARRMKIAHPSWIQSAFASSIRWRCKPCAKGTPKYIAIKPRSEVLMLADLFVGEFPESKHLFLYRDGLSWMRTIFRGFPLDFPLNDDDANRQMEERWSRMVPMVEEVRRNGSPLNPIQIRMGAWIACMEAAAQLSSDGMSCLKVRFEDLTAKPKAVSMAILSYCGVPALAERDLDNVLARDSQEGTLYDRRLRYQSKRLLPPDLERDAIDIIRSRPHLLRPDVVLPGTLSV